ncbi:MAG: hypothetical protein AB8G05_18365 [Oligoflexales bacterium]
MTIFNCYFCNGRRDKEDRYYIVSRKKNACCKRCLRVSEDIMGHLSIGGSEFGVSLFRSVMLLISRIEKVGVIQWSGDTEHLSLPIYIYDNLKGTFGKKNESDRKQCIKDQIIEQILAWMDDSKGVFSGTDHCDVCGKAKPIMYSEEEISTCLHEH